MRRSFLLHQLTINNHLAGLDLNILVRVCVVVFIAVVRVAVVVHVAVVFRVAVVVCVV